MYETLQIEEGLLAKCAAGGPSLSELIKIEGAMDPQDWRSCSDKAQVLANYLRCHPRVAEVRYPGLTCDPDYRQASSTLRAGFGPLLAIRTARAGFDGNGWHMIDTSKSELDTFGLVLLFEVLLC